MAPHIALNWVGAEFSIQQPDLEDKSFAEINPLVQVPVLLLKDGTTLSQCNAILRFISDSYPEAGIGGGNDPFSQYEINRWLSFIASDLHRSHAPYFFQSRFIVEGNDQQHTRIKQAAENQVQGLLKQFDRWLHGKSYLIGDKPCIADAYAFTVFRWSRNMTKPASSYSNIGVYMDRMQENTGVRLAMQKEGLLET